MNRILHVLLILAVIIFIFISYFWAAKEQVNNRINIIFTLDSTNDSLLEILSEPDIDFTKYLDVDRPGEFEKTHLLELYEWETVKNIFNRTYLLTSDENEAKKIFFQNLKHIREHNQKYERGELSYKLAINGHFDVPINNYVNVNYTEHVTNDQVSVDENFDSKKYSLPASVDWRKIRFFPPIKNQLSCGSCWAFAAAGVIEFHYLIYKNISVSLSVQQLIDCSYGNDGCVGGWIDEVFGYILQKSGIMIADDYPYEASTNPFCYIALTKSRFSIQGFHAIEKGNEKHLEKVVAKKGPVAVAIDARGDFPFYKSGIYYTPLCSSNYATHAVIVVGYGIESGQEYWIIRNSWGENWGENGYGRIAKNRNNTCGIITTNFNAVFINY